MTYIAKIGDKVRSNYFIEKGHSEEIVGEVTQVLNESMCLKILSGSESKEWISLPAKFVDGKNYMFDLLR